MRYTNRRLLLLCVLFIGIRLSLSFSVSVIEAIHRGQAVSEKGDDFTTDAWNYSVNDKCNDITHLAASATSRQTDWLAG